MFKWFKKVPFNFQSVLYYLRDTGGRIFNAKIIHQIRKDNKSNSPFKLLNLSTEFATRM